MTNSLALEVYPTCYGSPRAASSAPLSEPRIGRLSAIFSAATVKKQQAPSILAPKFKYKTNFPAEELQEIRKMLSSERFRQTEMDFHFWTPDFERIMKDDWLVTRFLLRGSSFSKKSTSDAKSVDASSMAEEKADMYLHTLDLIRSCAKFRLNYLINAHTRETDFPVEWLKQNGLFTHKTDLAENPVIYMRIRLHKPKLIETDELRYQFKRYLLFTLEQGDQVLFNQPGNGICCFFDMSKATLENIDLELISWMMKSFKSYSPKLLCYVIVYNLPWFFSATFRLITNTLMPHGSKLNLKFVYGSEVLSYIARDKLPSYLVDELGSSSS